MPDSPLVARSAHVDAGSIRRPAPRSSVTCRSASRPITRLSLHWDQSVGVGCILVVSTVAFVLGACGSDDNSANEPGVVAVTAVDFGYENLPDSVLAGTRLTLANTAPSELHEIVAILLPDDETRTASELMSLPPEDMGSLFAGQPATVLLTPPGGGADDQIAAVGDGTLSEPGRYLMLCAIPTGVSTDVYLTAAAESGGGPPEIEGGGPPHLAHGMWAELTVT